MDYLASLSDDFHVTTSTVKELKSFPSSSDFYRHFVSKSLPFKVLDFTQPTPSGESVPSFDPRLSSLSSLSSLLGDSLITVNVTPSHGKGDALFATSTDESSGAPSSFVFVPPVPLRMTFNDFVSRLFAPSPSPVYYYSQQDDNLRSSSELRLLSSLNLLPSSLPFVESCLMTGPHVAANLWVGDGRATTTMHSDPFENVYFVLKGVKRFVLVPPYYGGHLYEDDVPNGYWPEDELDKGEGAVPSVMRTAEKGDGTEGETPTTRWVGGDVECPEDVARLPNLAKAKYLVVEVNEGEALYLPAMWYHKVTSVGERETIAVNFWYDMEFDGLRWLTFNFAARVGEEERRRSENNNNCCSVAADKKKSEADAPPRAPPTSSSGRYNL